MPATAAYSAAKGALERWGESMAGEVAPFGLGVTILVTGTFDTEIITDAGTTDSRDLDGPYCATIPRWTGVAGRDAARECSRSDSPLAWRRRSTKGPFVRRRASAPTRGCC